MKKGFSLLLAIAFIIVVMTLGAFSLRFATFTSKINSDTYLKDQATLLGMFAAEYAYMAARSHNQTPDNCLEKVTINYPKQSPLLQANVYFNYFDATNCKNKNLGVTFANAELKNLNPAIITIEVKDHPNAQLTEHLRYVRRIVQ